MANVLYERVGAASLLTIDRPERRNAIDGQTAEELLAGYRSFESDENAHVLVVTGSGEKAFSAGADLKAIETLGPRVDSVEGVLGFTRLASPKPTIAAISGWCVGAGLVLALWCDLRIATEDAQFGFLDRKWGVPILDGGTKRLVATVGVSKALELAMTGREIDAPEAHRLGLVNEVVQMADMSSAPSSWRSSSQASHRRRSAPIGRPSASRSIALCLTASQERPK